MPIPVLAFRLRVEEAIQKSDVREIAEMLRDLVVDYDSETEKMRREIVELTFQVEELQRER